MSEAALQDAKKQRKGLLKCINDEKCLFTDGEAAIISEQFEKPLNETLEELNERTHKFVVALTRKWNFKFSGKFCESFFHLTPLLIFIIFRKKR